MGNSSFSFHPDDHGFGLLAYAVPGEVSYAWKLSLERLLLVVLSPSSQLESVTQMKLTDRRMEEVKAVINSEYAVTSLDSLNSQVNTTTEQLREMKQAQAKKELIDQYIATLNQVSQDLNQEAIQIQPGQTVPQQIAVTRAPTPQPRAQVAQVSSQGQAPTTRTVTEIKYVTVATDQTQVLEQIKMTQDQINQAIQELEKAKQEAALHLTPTPSPKGENAEHNYPTATPTPELNLIFSAPREPTATPTPQLPSTIPVAEPSTSRLHDFESNHSPTSSQSQPTTTENNSLPL